MVGLNVENPRHILQRIGEEIVAQRRVVEGDDIAIGEVMLSARAADQNLDIGLAGRLHEAQRLLA